VAHRDDIQGLRLLRFCWWPSATRACPSLGGYVGVDVFFVLSGFLITGILPREFAERGAISLPGFYLRRAGGFFPPPRSRSSSRHRRASPAQRRPRREAVGDSIWSALFAANVHFARQGSDYFAQGQPPSPSCISGRSRSRNSFYLVWPSVLAVLLALRFRRLLILVVAVGRGLARLVDPRHRRLARHGVLLDLRAGLGAGPRSLPRGCRARPPPAPVAAGLALGWGGLLAIGYAAFAYSEEHAPSPAWPRSCPPPERRS
jgi:peptidoglycan/LPS O-acetylase OafA/YrhL